ncbi:Oidioi.mRNA.OKI2018_I69.chr1.g1260.t1.cds [Oikopleura dioica]|uniref:Metalloendopeptidase n=1 Tax=Oikopleura dioica TaxID=34765 RepID=A0ABN7SSE3_OIKDI|nr:Oidioi.mRNA.OKI2018_I69.chr1.g1260.t1.cds [Oikopleura dioica]
MGMENGFPPEALRKRHFYSPITLRQFEEDGIDTTGFQRAADHIDNPDLGRGISAIFGQWENIDENGQNIIPFGFSNSWSESEKDKIADGALKMNPDLGCLEMRREDTSWTNGIIFVKASEIGQSGCFSALGVAQGFYNDGGFGYPSTWQAIALSEGCAGTSQRTVQHEILHALGVHHEHNRPDRDDYLNVDVSAASSPHNFRKIARDTWIETGHEIDISSVMTYCSYCGSISSDYPVMTTKTGVTFSSGVRMTTTDAIQVSSKYCAAPLEKETVSCSSSDILGKTHSVFTDRLCDNFRDCPNGEDENGELSPCEAVGGQLRWAVAKRCSSMNKSAFMTQNSASIYFVMETGSWYVGEGPQPEDISDGWRYFDDIKGDIEGGDWCPPQTVWNRGNAVACKVKPVTTDFCADEVCAGNLVCVNRLDQGECICKSPNFMKDGFCTIPENECESNSHNCTEDEICKDLQDGYECQPNPSVGDDDCCRTVVMETNLNNVIACEFESWVNDAMAYTCTQRHVGGYYFPEEMSLVYFQHLSNYYLLEGTIQHNKYAETIYWLDKLNVKSFRECPALGSPNEKGYNWMYDNIYTCEKVYEPHMGAWSEWSSCSNDESEDVDLDECGEVGTQIRKRSCDHWDPDQCDGAESTYEQQECGSYCSWSEWGEWSTCDAECGSEGKISRKRECPGDACDETEEDEEEEEKECSGSCPSYDYSCSDIKVVQIPEYCSDPSTNNFVSFYSAIADSDHSQFSPELGLYNFVQFRDGYFAQFKHAVLMHFTGDEMEDGLFHCKNFLDEFMDFDKLRSEDYEKPEKFELLALCSESPEADSEWEEWSDSEKECVNGKQIRFRKCPGKVCTGKAFELLDCEETTTDSATTTTMTTTTMISSPEGCLVSNFPKGLKPKKEEDVTFNQQGEEIILPEKRLVVICGDGFLSHINSNYAKASCSCDSDKCVLNDFSRELKCVSFKDAQMPIWSPIQAHKIVKLYSSENENFAVHKLKLKPWYNDKYYGDMVITKNSWRVEQFTLLVACPFETSSPSMLELLKTDEIALPLSESAASEYGKIYTFVSRPGFKLLSKQGRAASIAFGYDPSTLPAAADWSNKKKPGVVCSVAPLPGAYPNLGSDLYKYFGLNINLFMKSDKDLWASEEA